MRDESAPPKRRVYGYMAKRSLESVLAAGLLVLGIGMFQKAQAGRRQHGHHHGVGDAWQCGLRGDHQFPGWT